MAKRKAISKKVRFEVFKRDKFTCQYCGKSAPNVILHVDHIHPVAKSGSNEIVNLITSCFDCNMGKKDRTISDDSAISKQKNQLDLLQDRREQLQMMMEWSKGLANFAREKVEMLKEFWEGLTPGYELSESGVQSLGKLLSRYSIDEVLQAMQTASINYLKWSKGTLSSESVGVAFSKISGICNLNKLAIDNPDLKEFYYLRGILRNRINYCDQRLTIEWLTAARSWGASMEQLKQIVLTVRNWTAFSNAIDDLISLYKNEEL